MNTTKITLNGTWKMIRSVDGEEFDAKVPGTVLSVFLDNKVIEDPFYRRNEYKTRELFWEEYQFCHELKCQTVSEGRKH